MNESSYSEFIDSKRESWQATGFEPTKLNGMLFAFQRDIVRWALRKGKAAIFADCGMGKTAMQLEWAHHVHEKTGGIGSEGYVSIKKGRKFTGIELKKSYFDLACKNLDAAVEESNALTLFDFKEVS